MSPSTLSEDDLKDLGFGSRVSQQSQGRLLNRDGSFNVVRKGLGLLREYSPYHFLLNIPWARFYLIVALSYLAFNLFFAAGYMLCGPGALRGAEGITLGDRFLDAFFFSVQTSTTIGYGHISPVGVAANILVSIEAMSGLLGFALATSLFFARFSRPEARVVFSHRAIVAPYKGITALEFRIANERSTQLIQVAVKVVLNRIEHGSGGAKRRFRELSLERNEVQFFPLQWTVVHPIDAQSPLYGRTREEFYASDPEILILLTGIDETFSQTVHARSSYKGEEIVWGAKFTDMFDKSHDGIISVDLRRIHDFAEVTPFPPAQESS